MSASDFVDLPLATGVQIADHPYRSGIIVSPARKGCESPRYHDPFHPVKALFLSCGVDTTPITPASAPSGRDRRRGPAQKLQCSTWLSANARRQLDALRLMKDATPAVFIL